jgi:hypothetical protein
MTSLTFRAALTSIVMVTGVMVDGNFLKTGLESSA